MTGNTLILSREKNLHPFYVEKLKLKGFRDLIITDVDKDGLYNLIREINPSHVMVEASFYECCTPYMMSELLNVFPELNISAVNVFKYPDNLAKSFITNGVKSYVNILEGIDEFYIGLDKIKNGKNYISPNVKYILDLLPYLPAPAYSLTPKQIEITKLLCCGFKEKEIADILFISRTTIHKHKKEIYAILNISSNPHRLIRTALKLEIVKQDELYFNPANFEISKKTTTRNKRRK